MASVNNGVFICINCAAIHAGFADSLCSQVKSTTLDPWGENDLKYMTYGGNKKLAKFFEEYGLQDEMGEMRLQSECAAYYRRQLTALVTNDQEYAEKAPSLKDGRGPQKKPSVSIWGKVVLGAGVAAAATKGKMDDTGVTQKWQDSKAYVKGKYEEHKVGEKASAAGTAVKDGAVKAGSAVKEGAGKAADWTKEKYTEYEVGQKASAAGAKVKQGAGKAADWTKGKYQEHQVGEKAAAAGQAAKESAAKAGAFVGGLFKKKKEE